MEELPVSTYSAVPQSALLNLGPGYGLESSMATMEQDQADERRLMD